MQKIRYRLVYNRKKKLNKQGKALIQVEAKLNQRNIYLSTNIYIEPEYWCSQSSRIINHPHSSLLNSMLFEFILKLQSIELSYWKRDIPVTLSLIKENIKKKKVCSLTFFDFAHNHLSISDRKLSTKNNILTTLTTLKSFRSSLDFNDLTYTFLKEFEVYLREKGNGINTIAKHMRQLRTLINEAINQGYISPDAYPFRKYKIKQEKGRHTFLTPAELKKVENHIPSDNKERKVLNAFLFCCYVGLRYSDFCSLQPSNIVKISNKYWLQLKSIKTGTETEIPISLLFEGKALDILNKQDLADLTSLPANPDVNKTLSRIFSKLKIKKHITFHSARHTCATLLLYQGVPITTVQKLLGHTSVKTTEIYSQVMNTTIVKDLQQANKKKKNVKHYEESA